MNYFLSFTCLFILSGTLSIAKSSARIIFTSNFIEPSINFCSSQNRH